MAKPPKAAKAEKRQKRTSKGRASGGASDLLGVVMAGVALSAAAIASLRRHARPAAASAGGLNGSARPRSRKEATGIKLRLRRFGARYPAFGRVLDVQERYSDINGNNLAAAVTFQAFISLFPLLIVFVAVVGFIDARGGVNVAGRVVGELGLTGDAASAVVDAVKAARDSRRAASVIGVTTLLWSGLGLVNALQYAYNQVWQVEARGIRDKAIGLAWLVGAALLFVAAAAITTVLRWLPGFLAPLGIAIGVLANFGLWLGSGTLLPNTKLSWRTMVPGALVGAIGLEILKAVGAIWVPRAVASSSQLYGSLGVVFAVLAWLLFFGRLTLYSAVVNVVAHERREGTVLETIEVPNQPGAVPGEEVSRVGRLERTA